MEVEENRVARPPTARRRASRSSCDSRVSTATTGRHLARRHSSWSGYCEGPVKSVPPPNPGFALFLLTSAIALKLVIALCLARGGHREQGKYASSPSRATE